VQLSRTSPSSWPTKRTGRVTDGLAFFNDDAGEIRPGVVVMPAGGGSFWIEIAQDLRDASPRGYAKLLATYPDGTGGLDLQPLFDLITIHGSRQRCSRSTVRRDWFASGIDFTQPITSTPARPQPRHWRLFSQPKSAQPSDERSEIGVRRKSPFEHSRRDGCFPPNGATQKKPRLTRDPITDAHCGGQGRPNLAATASQFPRATERLTAAGRACRRRSLNASRRGLSWCGWTPSQYDDLNGDDHRVVLEDLALG
jgi:hypothetical protein